MINGIDEQTFDGRPQWGNGVDSMMQLAIRNSQWVLRPLIMLLGILGTQEINTRASIYRPGTRITLSGTNTNYTLRMMATYASGRSNNGWAYVISG
jgi:hypothetical protein